MTCGQSGFEPELSTRNGSTPYESATSMERSAVHQRSSEIQLSDSKEKPILQSILNQISVTSASVAEIMTN